ncbi:hypothetical protein JCM10213v2_005453 [Rhodosporidiobolus nylandii]
MTSLSTTTTLDKSKEEGNAGVYPSLGGLPDVPEKDEDEGAKIAGYERQEVSQEEMDAVGRKIDRRILPLLAVTYFSQFWDNGFVVAEIPSSALANRLPMAKYLGVNVTLWAIAKFGAFFTMRVFLGIFESCVSPVSIVLPAIPHHGITSMFGGLVAWAVTHYKGDAIAHWRIFYVMQGGLALVVGAALLLYLPDSIGTAKFLTEREKIVAYERVRDNGTGGRVKKLKRSHVIEAVTDIKTWTLMLLTALSSIPNGGLGAFSSILIKGFGYTSQETLLLQIPRGFIATCTTITVCWISDKYQQRMLPIFIAVIPTILGAALMVGFNGKSEGGSLAGSLMAETYGSALALQYAWTASNTGGASKKAVTVFGIGNIVEQAALDRLIAENGWTEEDVARERDKAAFLDLTDRENPFTRYYN